MKNRLNLVIASLCMILNAIPAVAHFGAVIPSDDIISSKDARSLNIDIKFIHPMEQHYMEMDKPMD